MERKTECQTLIHFDLQSQHENKLKVFIEKNNLVRKQFLGTMSEKLLQGVDGKVTSHFQECSQIEMKGEIKMF